MLAALMYAGLMGAFAALPAYLREDSNDLKIYRAAGENLLAGNVPYRDFFIEYPPGSLIFFVPPALVSSSPTGYDVSFANEMALLLVVCLVLAARTAKGLAGPFYALIPCAALVLGAVLLWPVAVTRYDPVVALTMSVPYATVGAIAGARSLGGPLAAALAYASLGLGAAAKLIPALGTAPLALLNARRAVFGYAVFFAVVLALLVPALLLGEERFLGSFAYHVDRGLQIESVASSVLMQLGNVRAVELAFGAFEVAGPGAGLAASLSFPVTLALLLVTTVAAYRRRGVGSAAGYYARYAAALVLAFLIGSKVLSPQYLIWLLPLVPLSAGGVAGVVVCALFTVACLLTGLIYPVFYDGLLNLEFPGPALLLARNGLLIVLWLLLLALPASTILGEEET